MEIFGVNNFFSLRCHKKFNIYFAVLIKNRIFIAL